jgi:hypothetical protein
MRPDNVISPVGIVSLLFFGTWFVLVIGGLTYFYLGKDYSFKRKWYPRFMMFAGFYFVFSMITLSALYSHSRGGSPIMDVLPMVLVVLPMVFFGLLMTIKFTKFCRGCGSTLYDFNMFSPMKFCPKCGEGLDQKPIVYGDTLD